MPLKRSNTQKHLGLFLDAALSFSEYINEKMKKAVKAISVIKKIKVSLPCFSLLTIYKSFIRPYLNYGDIIYDQPNNHRLSEKNESIQYNAAILISGAIRGTSKEKLYLEKGLESLKGRRWSGRLCYLHKVLSTKLPTYLFTKLPTYLPLIPLIKLIPPILNSHFNPGCYRALYCRPDLFYLFYQIFFTFQY